jgi:2-octaprenylphenol hydroxylase
MPKHYDMIIVGAGMVGLAQALALAPSGLQIGVIEGRAPELDYDTKDYDLRVISVNEASRQFLQALNVWPSIAAERISPFDGMRVWADNSELTFNAADIDEPELGNIVENRVLRKALWQRAQKTENITLICPSTITEVVLGEPVTVHSEKAHYTCDLIIGADGAKSWLRQHLNWPLRTDDYQHHALVTTVTTEQPHQQTAWQHFLPQGPLAFLPLQDAHHCSIVWSSTPEHIAQLKQCDTKTFNQKIMRAFNHRLGETHCIAPRVSFPLIRQHLVNYVDEHIAFIGDAAHRIHPLAGQGANLGFMDAKCLAHYILLALKNKKAYTTLSVLKRYQRERKYYNGQMLLMMDTFKRTFSTSSNTLATLRNIGLEKLNHTKTLKKLFTRSASGG